ncbi:efflux RND transporter periplasmic adaptor subunit [Fusibacter ferrireducens]|uniref:Efflux RND transporter periplasmic adaptor subunit n=1 Tax=Fusibacter ferrireducens TaxID=2785058 RepID=A0ABR9ZQ48_9FIRM|nr:efflux RND transporter periplasmic adaptor subunit [Fusibacter ferrireducens]MBF4692587.1 efflux RND transporter periplasmic adaptor subunit [Fusibacter ferrireducens]
MKIKNKKGRVAIALLGIIMIFLLSGCNTDEAVKTEYRNVKTLLIANTDQSTFEGLSGNVTPMETVKMSFKIDGVIERIFVKEGQAVMKGDLIAKLKDRDYNLALDAAKAQYDAAKMQISKDIPNLLDQAKAQLELTQLTYDRVKALYENGAVSKSQWDEISAKLIVDKSTYKQAQDAYEIATVQLGQAKAAYEMAQKNIEETSIYSPMDGILLKKMSSEGEVQGAGYPVVALGSVENMWAEFGVTDEQINAFKIGEEMPVYVYGADVEVKGIVDEIGALADEKTRLFTVKLKLENKDGLLKSGMIAKSELQSEKSGKIYVPFLSVVHLSSGEIVYLYDETSHKVKACPVTTGVLLDDRIEILKGLAEGDVLVIEGQYQISDGEEVMIND